MKDSSILQNVQARESSLLRSVYMWLFAGLLVTAAVSYGVSMSTTLLRLIYGNPFVLIVIACVQVFVAVSLGARAERMSEGGAIASFLVYACLTGVTFSSIFLLFSEASITKAFISAAAVFLGASVYGSLTKKDVRSWSRFLFMGLFGLIIATLINLIFYTSTLDLIISAFGVVLFTGLTVWDTNKICAMNRQFGADMTSSELTKLGIIGALDLYLDFINIFLYLLRIFGRNND